MLNNLSPKLFSGSAVVVGYLLMDDLTSSEQNALGNWLMLTAQVLCTNAYYMALKEEKNSNDDITNEIDILTKMVKALNKEIENLKKDN